MNKTILKKIGSYFWPITKKITSDINGDLELTWYQGKKVLDTKNANFSYGSLDNILTEAFKYTSIKPKDTVLILGLGGGNFIQKIKTEFLHKGKITAIELDAKIIQIAKNEFGIQNNNQLKIIHQDAFAFVQDTLDTFDFIFIDIFVDNVVPTVFYSDKFWKQIPDLLNDNGKFLFNAGITLKDQNKINEISKLLSSKINVFKKEKINHTNTLVFGTKK